MGTISQKLDYLNTTKGKIKDSINLTGANIISTDTFRSYATKLKNGLVDIINNGIDTLYDNFPKVTAEGTEIVLNNTYEAPIKLNVVKGDAQQDSYSGKNQIGLQDIPSTTTNALTYSISNGVFSINGTASAKTTIQNILFNLTTNTSKRLKVYLDSGTFTAGAFGISLRDSNNNQISFIQMAYNIQDLDTTKTISLTGVDHIELYVTNATVFNNAKFRLILVDGGESISYEPYVGGKASPNPDYPQNINVVTGLQNVSVNDGTNTTNYEADLGTLELCKIGDYQDTLQKSTGKNLFDANNNTYKDTSVTHTINNTNKITVTNSYSWARLETTIKNLTPNTNYTISTDITNASGLNCGLWGASGLSNLSTNTNFKSSITKQSDSSGNLEFYFYVNYSGTTTSTGTVIFDTIQLEENSQVTEYEPFGKIWYKKANIGKIVLDDSESWTNQTVYDTTGYSRFSTFTYSTPYNNGYNNRFTQRVSQAHGSYEYLWLQPNTGATYIQLLSSRLSSADVVGFKSWLSNNNVTFYYILATPTYEVVTNDTLINQLESIKSKEDSTNITISGNLPMIINASALEKE